MLGYLVLIIMNDYSRVDQSQSVFSELKGVVKLV